MDDSGKPSWKGESRKALLPGVQDARKRLGIPWEILERDYALSWLLAGVMTVYQIQSYWDLYFHIVSHSGNSPYSLIFFELGFSNFYILTFPRYGVNVYLHTI